VVEGLAIALLAGLIVRYSVGYIPRFFVVSMPIAATLVAAATVAALARRAGRSICDLALVALVSGATLVLGLTQAGLIAPAPMALYRFRVHSEGQAVVHSLPGSRRLFLDGFDKSQLRSLNDLPAWADRYSERWRDRLVEQGFSQQEAKAIGLMLFTSTLWAFGNEKQPDEPGCITVNERNGWRYQAPTLEVVKQASVGCCTDFAYALSLALAGNGFENRYVILPGHILNEAKIDGRWRVLDANTNIYVNASWNEAADSQDGLRVHLFPHPSTMSGKLYRAVTDDFQNYLVNLLLIDEAPKAKILAGRPTQTPASAAIDRLY
jgi:hypothetical protein